MKNYKNLLKVRKAAFTLVELLTVIAIIGILAAIVIPAVGGVQKRANLAKSQSNLKGIATAHVTYTTGGGKVQAIVAPGTNGKNTPQEGAAANAADWAKVLAYRADLNDASLYFIESWSVVATQGGVPPSVQSSEFNNSSPISYNMLRGVSKNSSTIPLIWTTGLSEGNLSWSANSPWEGNEGHIAFADAHVNYYQAPLGERAVDNLLQADGENTATSLTQVTPTGTVILESSAHSVAQ